jgi:hypothetical protein
MHAFIEAGYCVSLPFGDGCPYDLIIDDGDRLYRVECKTARLGTDGAISVWMMSNNGRWGKGQAPRMYAGRVDLLAAYCPETDKVYVIGGQDLAHRGLRLRITPAANNQTKGIRWARDFELTALTCSSSQ